MSSNKQKGTWIAVGVALGIVFGEALFDNVGVGIAIGVALGIAFANAKRDCKTKQSGSEE